MGTPQAAVPSLQAIAASRHVVVGVACQPDRPGSRGRHVVAPAVKQAALGLGCRILQPESVKTTAFRSDVAELEPDILVVVAYGRLLGPKLLALPRHGAVNLHFSLLPRWRGAAPVQRAILAGDAVSGVSIIRLVDEMDAGPVLASQELALEPGEHSPSLEERMAAMGATLLVATLDAIEAGLAVASPQDASAVTLAAPLHKNEGWLDAREDALALARRVCAFDPWPGARLLLARGSVSVLDAIALDEAPAAEPGTILAPRGEDVPMACGRGVLLLRRVKPEGRAAMTARSLVNGRFVLVGERALLPPSGSPSAGNPAVGDPSA